MASSDGEDPGGRKPKPPPSSTLAGMPAPKEPTSAPHTRATLPPPKTQPHRSQPPTNAPPKHDASVSNAIPQPAAPHTTPLVGSQSSTVPNPRQLGSQPPSGPNTIPQFAAHPQSQPLDPHSAPHPQPLHQSAPHPAFGQPPSGPTGITQPEFGAIGHRPYTPGDSLVDEVPGSQFVKFLKISSRRAFRLRIEPNEVLPSERASLEAASPPILDPNLQAFLAWRRSVLFLVAVALVPLSILGLVDAVAASMPTPIRIVKLAPALTEGLFCWICWNELKRWSHWRIQRRRLFWGWVLFMVTPFVVFVFPLRPSVSEGISAPLQTLSAFGIDAQGYRRSVTPFVYAMIAMLQLAPKAISLMPGLIRASLVIKLLFPGSSAPGWLIVMAAPLYALLAYVILIIPYQFTGSGWFIAGVLGVIIGQFVLARAGFSLAKPMNEAESLRNIRRVRTLYITVMIVSAVLIVVALGSLVRQLDMRAVDVITAVMKFETNVLILTMIGADLVITNLDRARMHNIGRSHVEEQAEVKIAAFVSIDAPHTPPPPGPAL